MKILYVEDEPFDAELTQLWCARRAPHLTFDVVGTVAEAQQRLQQTTALAYDIILTDMHLPDGNGLAVLSLVHDLALHIPVVIIAGGDDDSTVATAMQAGATAYIVKRVGYLEDLPATLEQARQR